MSSVGNYETRRRTFKYKTTKAGLDVHLDVQIPTDEQLLSTSSKTKLPVLISIHGGALMNGSRRDPMYPSLVEKLLQAGCLIIYPDYRLLQPSTCHDQLGDISHMLDYLASSSFSQGLASYLPSNTSMDIDNVAVAGFSAGSYIARILTVYTLKHHTRIQIKACLLFYGMGGDFFLDYWIKPRLPLDTPPPAHAIGLEEISDCPYSDHLPGYGEALRRTPWCEWWWNTATFLDLCTGEKGLSMALREFDTSSQREEYMVTRQGTQQKQDKYGYEDLFPQLYLRNDENAGSWPPTMLIHGTADPAVPLEESLHTFAQLGHYQDKHVLLQVQGGNHDLNDVKTGIPLPEKEEAIAKAADFIILRIARRK